MAKEKKKYTRLPGRKNSLSGYHSLWLGEDHLLRIYSKHFSEDYKRFYYTDIQSIITRKTVTGKIRNLFLGLFGGVFCYAAYVAANEASLFLLITAGAFLTGLLFNWVGGPTCACSIQTAVQIEKLPSLNKLKTAEKALSRLRPLIERVQGGLSPEPS